jgi:hypothetical protein
MTLIRFRDNTYGHPCIVAACDMVRAIDLGKRVVAMRHPDGTKFADDGHSLRNGEGTCILLTYIPESAKEKARAAVAAAALPEMCVAVLQPQDVLIGIKRGQRGYYQMYDGTIKGEAARAVADRMNEALKASPQQREAMLVGSMMGWDCPAARSSCPLHANATSYTQEQSQ